MHRFPSWDNRTKSKSANSPVQPTRSRASSTLSLLQSSQIHARASSVVRKVLGPRSPLKDPTAFVDPVGRASCDKPRPSADLIGPEALTRPRRNTTTVSPADSLTQPKPLTASLVNNATCPAVPGASGSTFQLHLPLDSLLFSPISDDHDHDHNHDQRDMSSATTSPNERPAVIKGSPEMSDSGYASGHSSHAGLALAAPNASPVVTKTPRTLGRSMPIPTTPGSMRLSPSVTRSMMPMPILNLPALPPTPTHTHALPRTRSFQPGEMRHVKKAMPALMRHGTSNMHMEEQQEDDDDDDDGSTDGSDSSDTEEATPAEGSSPETRDSIESIEESAERSGSEDNGYFDAREAHTPAPSEPDPVGLSTPRASQQNQPLLTETSALGLQITPGPPTTNGLSPWTMVDATPGLDRHVGNGQGTSRSDYFSHPVAAVRQAFKSPHRTPRVSELLSVGSPSRVNISTPRAPPLSPTSSIAARRARAATILRDANGESPRPGLYHQASQSMMNLTSPTTEDAVLSPFATARSPLLTPRDGLPTIAATPGTPAAAMPTPLMRRNSMPTMLRHPPTYKELYPSVPREEEGKEKLPPYSCGIHIEALMPRKMEFSAPGVLSKDRAWKKQYIVLHGTSLFIYRHDIRKQPIGGKVKGKERYEGVVTEDEVDLDSPTVHLPGHESNIPRPPLKVNTPMRRSSSHTRSSSSTTTENSSRSSLLSRFHGNSSRATIPTPPEPTPSDDKGSSSQGTVSVSTASGNTPVRRWSHNQAPSSFASSLSHFNAPFSSPNTLVRHYTLQKSESGLGSDYYKKRNVIRVRCEGEQFLLQAENVMQVVDWIEALQAGTNVALDLDERPMTKPPPFPRRRRRRRRPADASATPGASGSGAAPSSANNASENNTPNN